MHMRNVYFLSQQVMAIEAIRAEQENEKKKKLKSNVRLGAYRMAAECDPEQNPEESGVLENSIKAVRDKLRLWKIKWKLNHDDLGSLSLNKWLAEYKDLPKEVADEIFCQKNAECILMTNINFFSAEAQLYIVEKILEKGGGQVLVESLYNFPLIDRRKIVEMILGGNSVSALFPLITFREHLIGGGEIQVVFNRLIELGVGEELLKCLLHRKISEEEMRGAFWLYLEKEKLRDTDENRESLVKNLQMNGLEKYLEIVKLEEIYPEDSLEDTEIILDEEDFLEVRELKN
jgi:hypothetical protein